MPELIRCSNCPATLRIPDGAAGKVIRCPKCRAVVPVPLPPPPLPEPEAMTAELLPLPPQPTRVKAELLDETAATPALIEEPLAKRSSVPEATEKKKSKGKRKKRRWFRWLQVSAIGDSARNVGLVWLFVLLAITSIGFAIYFGLRAWDPPTIPPDRWETVEVPSRFRAKLPGKIERQMSARFGPRMELHLCEPNSTSIYLVGCAIDPLPAEKLARPPDKVLEEVSSGALGGLSGRGWKQLRRDPTPVGLHEGVQLVVEVKNPRVRNPERRIPGGYLIAGSGGYLDDAQMAWPGGGNGKVIVRYYLAHGRVFVILAGGANFEARQENVKRLFDSFEILEPPVPTDRADPAP